MMPQFGASLSDNSRVVIDDHNVFIIQVTEVKYYRESNKATTTVFLLYDVTTGTIYSVDAFRPSLSCSCRDLKRNENALKTQ